jgi:hypothetical protein
MMFRSNKQLDITYSHFYNHQSKEPKVRMTQLKRGVRTECIPKHYERQHSPFFSKMCIGSVAFHNATLPILQQNVHWAEEFILLSPLAGALA